LIFTHRKAKIKSTKAERKNGGLLGAWSASGVLPPSSGAIRGMVGVAPPSPNAPGGSKPGHQTGAPLRVRAGIKPCPRPGCADPLEGGTGGRVAAGSPFLPFFTPAAAPPFGGLRPGGRKPRGASGHAVTPGLGAAGLTSRHSPTRDHRRPFPPPAFHVSARLLPYIRGVALAWGQGGKGPCARSKPS